MYCSFSFIYFYMFCVVFFFNFYISIMIFWFCLSHVRLWCAQEFFNRTGGFIDLILGCGNMLQNDSLQITGMKYRFIVDGLIRWSTNLSSFEVIKNNIGHPHLEGPLNCSSNQADDLVRAYCKWATTNLLITTSLDIRIQLLWWKDIESQSQNIGREKKSIAIERFSARSPNDISLILRTFAKHK